MKATSIEPLIGPMSNLVKLLPGISTGCCNFMGSDENGVMVNRNNVEIELIKLANGARLLRFTEPKSGLTLERKLDPRRPVSAQRQALAKVFDAALAEAELPSAAQ
jgi:hypothetical protein